MIKKIVVMMMMDGEFIGEKVLFFPENHVDWDDHPLPNTNDAEHFFY